jgi:hypothetical protein
MKYFAMVDGQQIGPLELEQLADAGVRPDTYVWCKGMADWQQARTVADICRHFRNRLHDKMHPQAEIPVAQLLQEPAEQAAELSAPPRFRRYIDESDSAATWHDEIRDPDLSRPPSTWYPFPMVFAIILCLPLGIWAALQARRAKEEWDKGLAAKAHETARQAKMCAGIGISIGMIFIAMLIRTLI